MITALHNLEGKESSIYLNNTYDRYPETYHILLGDAVDDIEDCSEDDYRIIKNKLGQMGKFSSQKNPKHD